MSLPPGVVTAQGQTSLTWKAPPLATPPLLPDLVAWHLEHSGDHIYARTSTGRSVTVRAYLRASHRAGRLLSTTLVDAQPVNGIVAILAEQEAFSVAAYILGTICAGLVPFNLSIRNSAAGIADLCRKTGCQNLFVTPTSAALRRLALDAREELMKEGIGLRLLDLPSLDAIYPRFGQEVVDDAFEPLALPASVSVDSPCLYLHSSGSTSFPKPIPWTHAFCIRANSWPYYGSKDICGRSWFVGASPSFHMAGVSNHILVPLLTGVEIVLFDPSVKAWPPTPELVIDAVANSRPKDMSVVPSFLEAWATEPKSVDVLRSCERVIFGGGPLGQEVGDELIDAGVNLANIYGTTEIGVINSLVDAPTRDWAWLRISPQARVRLEAAGDDDTFVLHVLSSELHEVAVSNVAGEKAFDTNDLVRRHPDYADVVCIVGRADSQIMLANGEKVNPEPMERTIESNGLVDRVVMFGRGRLACGILVQPSASAASMNVDALVDGIWPDVSRANTSAPQHARLFRNLVVVSDPARPFELTAKANVKRHTVLEQYAADIDRAYQETETGGDSMGEGVGLTDAIERAVKLVLQVDALDPDADFFSLGCDSLQAAYLKRSLAPLAPTVKLPANLVYIAPTVAKLAAYIEKQRQSETHGDSTSDADTHSAAMRDAIDRLTRSFSPTRAAAITDASKASRTFLITGTTGALGSQLLAILLLSPDVRHVFALNRAGKGSSLGERQLDAFRSREIDTEILSSDKLTLLEGSLASSGLGLEGEVLQQISNEVDVIIHCAWRVNFKFPLSGFDSDLQGLRNLVDVALGARRTPHVVFTSSIADLAGWPTDRFGPERVLDEPRTAVGQGYGESKYVGSRMLQAASSATGLRTTVIRTGQLAGARSSGAWTTSEWFAAMIKSSETLGCLPNGGDCVAWVPIDDAACCIYDMSIGHPSDSPHSLLNLVHPRPVEWSSLIGPIAEHLGVPLVPYNTWVDKLAEYAEREGQAGLERNPAIHLIDMFKFAKVAASPRVAQEALDMPRLETTLAEKASKTLRSLDQLGAADAVRWVRHWQGTGFLASCRPSTREA